MDSHNHGATTLNRKDIDKRLAPFRIPGLELWASSRYSRLFQDSAGTIVADTATDPVGMIADLSGNGRHALQTVSARRPTLTESGGGLRVVYDGVDDFLDCGNVLGYTASNFSFIAKINTSTSAATQMIVAKNDGYELYINITTGKLVARIRSGGSGTSAIIAGDSDITDGIDHTVGMTFDQTLVTENIKMFVDGNRQVATADWTNFPAANAFSLQIAARANGVIFTGINDETLSYSKALNDDEMLMLSE